jgi:hypothetical protein
VQKLDLQKSIETFAVFDILMFLIALFGLILGTVGIFLGNEWLYLTYAMILGGLMLVYGILLAPKRIKISRYRESIGKSPSVWLKVAFISDLHLQPKKSKQWVEKTVAKLHNEKPDLLLLGGDMVVHDSADIQFLEPIKNLETTYGAFYILGNHDYQDNPKLITRKLTSYGLHSLINTGVSLSVQGKELRLAGADDGFYGVAHPSILHRPDNMPHIVLIHEPDLIRDIPEGQTDLALAGHSHGGQIRLPFIGALHVPSVFGRKADIGRKIIKGIPTIITGGLGEVGCRARLFNPPEIVIIELGI